MALWQFDVFLVPRRAVLELGGANPLTLRSVAWKDTDLPDDYRQQLSAITLPTSSWSSHIEMWGQEDGSRIDVSVRDGKVRQILVRFDMRDLDPSFVSGILAFARAAACVLLTTDGDVIDPDADAVIENMTRSKAFRFVRDPKGFISALAQSRRPS